MPLNQRWTLSQECNKSNGICSVCFATRQLHIKDNKIHVHGPRNNPCAGSNKPPLSIPSNKSAYQIENSSSDILSNLHEGTNNVTRSTLTNDFLRIHNTHTNSDPDPNLDVSVPTLLSGNSYASILQHPKFNCAIIKHIPKSARSACAKLLSEILQKIVSDSNEISAWSKLLYYAPTILEKPAKKGQNDSLASVIKKKTTNYLLQNTIIEESTVR